MSPKLAIIGFFVLAYGCFVTFSPAVHSELDIDGYFIPLVGDCGVIMPYHESADLEPTPATMLAIQSNANRHSCQYIGIETVSLATTQSTQSDGTVLQNIQAVAVIGSMIVGKADGKFFTFDTSKDPVTDNAKVFENEDDWKTALAQARINHIPTLLDPKQFVKGVPDRILHRQDYYRFQGVLGWPDYTWSNNILLLAIVFVLVYGLVSEYPSLGTVAIIVGITVDVLCELILGDGPGTLPGAFVFPFLFWAIGGIGRLLRKFNLRLYRDRQARVFARSFAGRVSADAAGRDSGNTVR